MTPAPSPDTLTKAQNSPWVIYALIFVLVVSALAQAVPKIQQILGPIGKALGGRADEAKRAAIAADGQVDQMRLDQIDELVKWKRDQEERNRLHSDWDMRAYAALKAAGVEIDPPPSLY